MVFFVWLGGMVLWAIGCVIVHDAYLLPRRIPVEGWPAAVMIVGGAVTFIWPYWGTWLFWWAVGMGIYALVAFTIVNSMDAAALKAAGWPFIVIMAGGVAAILWPLLLSRDETDGQ